MGLTGEARAALDKLSGDLLRNGIHSHSELRQGAVAAMLLDVISEWANIVHESAASARMAEIKAGMGETWFAWSGPTTVSPGSNIAAYYRIQGPNLVIEYAPQRLGGDPSLHVHTMYRDPTNDYGWKFAAK